MTSLGVPSRFGEDLSLCVQPVLLRRAQCPGPAAGFVNLVGPGAHGLDELLGERCKVALLNLGELGLFVLSLLSLGVRSPPLQIEVCLVSWSVVAG